MLSNKYKLSSLILCSLLITACSEDTEDDQEKQDQEKLDEIARELDEQMPSARAERIAEENQENSEK